MIRKLKHRFVTASMTAVSILLIFLLSAINISNVIVVHNDIQRTLNIITTNEINPTNLQRPDAPSHGPGKEAPDKLLATNFALIRFDQNGNPLNIDSSRIATRSEDEVLQLAEEALKADQEEGVLNRYLYKIVERNNGKTVILLDTSEEKNSVLRFLGLSLIVGLTCFGLMYLLILAMAKKALSPIIENIEKQKQFVTNAGHELKTPLAIMQANAEALELYQGENKWTKNIKTQVTHLTKLTNDMLMLARYDENSLTTHREKVVLIDLIHKNLDPFSASIEQKELKIDVLATQRLKIHTDPELLSQLLSLLLDNAVKYTPNRGTIAIEQKQIKGRLYVNLTNTCTTLPDCPAERLFDRFYRPDTARSQKNGGSGIGLSAATLLAQSLNIELTCSYPDDTHIRFQLRF